MGVPISKCFTKFDAMVRQVMYAVRGIRRPSVAVLGIALLACAMVAQAGGIPVYGYHVVHRYPHDPHAFTEGLFYRDGYLYESTGELGESSLRKVNLHTGKVVQQVMLPAEYFGEGIVPWHGTLIQLTWRHGMGIIYDLASFKPMRRFLYSGEGWALTRGGGRIYMSDGTPDLRVLDPDTLQQIGTIHVTADGKPVRNLNELEWVKGQIYANVWLTQRIARIDPSTGHVVGWVDLSGLFDSNSLAEPYDDVLNGIAYDAKDDRLFVTGKRWPALFEIKLTRMHSKADRLSP